MDLNRLLSDHQIALIQAGEPSTVGETASLNEAVRNSAELIERARNKLGVIAYALPFAPLPLRLRD